MALLVVSQQLHAQLVKDEFSQLVFSDNFDDDKGNFPSISNSDNLFVIQDGEYLLRRKNPFNGYSVFTTWKNTLPAYTLVASMKLEEAKVDESSVGLIFMAQEDGTGAFVFEINGKGQYRLKQLIGVNFKLLTGEIKTNGWMTSTLLNPVGQSNLVEIRTTKRNYDIYLNQKYLLSFTELAYKMGDIGIAIGPSTKASVSYINVYTTKENMKQDSLQAGGSSDSTAAKKDTSVSPGTNMKYDPGLGSTSDVILKLIERVTKLSAENQVLRDSINILKKQLPKKPVNRSRTSGKAPANAEEEIQPGEKQ